MRKRTSAPLAATAAMAAALVLGGCGGANQQQTVDWTNGLCSSYATFRAAAQKGPAAAADVAGQVRNLSAYLGSTAGSLDQALAGIDQLGASPVSGGDEAVTRFRDQLTRFRSAFQQAKAQVDALNPKSPTIAAQLPAAVAPVLQLQQDSRQDPLAGLGSDVLAAAAKAPACQQLGQTG